MKSSWPMIRKCMRRQRNLKMPHIKVTMGYVGVYIGHHAIVASYVDWVPYGSLDMMDHAAAVGIHLGSYQDLSVK